MQSRTVYYRNNLSGETAYKSFLPSPLLPNPSLIIDDEIVMLLTEASMSISVMRDISSRIPNKILFTAAYVRKEALLSSQIEGTQATLEDIFDPFIEMNSNKNVEEVVNYINTLNFAINRLEELPVRNRLLRETHLILMKGVRGKDKYPGEFRRSQN